MTPLEAANVILTRNRRRPVTALQTGDASDAGNAERTLDEVSRRIQEQGWHFNVRENVELTPDGNDKVAMPDGAMWIDTDRGSITLDVAENGDYLYNRKDNDFLFDSNIRVTYPVFLAFDCIPDPVAQYIAAVAAREYCERYGDMQLWPILQRNEERTQALAERHEAESSDANVLSTPESSRLKGWRNRVRIAP